MIFAVITKISQPFRTKKANLDKLDEKDKLSRSNKASTWHISFLSDFLKDKQESFHETVTFTRLMYSALSQQLSGVDWLIYSLSPYLPEYIDTIALSDTDNL